VYVLPNDIMYARTVANTKCEPDADDERIHVSIQFSGNLAVIKTKPGYASSMAYDIDNHNYAQILGTIAGDDTMVLVLKEGTKPPAQICKLADVREPE
jgi:transcriptional regulator of arginine metabolism